MAEKLERNLIVGLDIGTSKVSVVVGETTDEYGAIEIVGIGTSQSKGLKKGVVVNLELTIKSIQKAIEEAELMAGCQIKSVFAGIAGGHIRSINSHGVIAIRDKEVARFDMERVIDSAQAVAIPADQRILHILPQEFVIDLHEGIKDPIEMSGTRLEAKVHIVTGSISAYQNIVKCINSCGIEIEDIVLEQLASSNAVLTEDEKELGVCLVDIGGGTTDIAIFVNGAIKHTAVIPVAGDQVTNDIAIALRTPTLSAEGIKIKYACALAKLASEDILIEVPSIGDKAHRSISIQNLSEIIEPRYEELMQMVQSELRRSGNEGLIAAGIVLTGGSSKVKGILELTEELFHLPVRMGGAHSVTGLTDRVKSPIYSTAVGLLLYGREYPHLAKHYQKGNLEWFYKAKNWFQNNF